MSRHPDIVETKLCNSTNSCLSKCKPPYFNSHASTWPLSLAMHKAIPFPIPFIHGRMTWSVIALTRAVVESWRHLIPQTRWKVRPRMALSISEMHSSKSTLRNKIMHKRVHLHLPRTIDFILTFELLQNWMASRIPAPCVHNTENYCCWDNDLWNVIN